jgi:hypothetical protein
MDTPGRSGLTLDRKAGMAPKMISRTTGKPTPQMIPMRSRRNRRSSAWVSRRRMGARAGAAGAGGRVAVALDIVISLHLPLVRDSG